MPKKKPKTGKPNVHKDIKGFEVTINEFGEIKSNMNVEELNKFLNKNVEDKKFEGREDIDKNWLPVEPEQEKEETLDDLMRDVSDKEIRNLKSKKKKKKK